MNRFPQGETPEGQGIKPFQGHGEQTGPGAGTPEVPSAAQEAAAASEAPSAVRPAMEEAMADLAPGKVMHGRVVHVGTDEVLVDVGYKCDGRIPIHELGLRSGQTPADVLKPGDEVDVYVLRVDDNEGGVLLSKRRADQELTWRRLEEAKEQGRIIEARVTERVKGGLLVDVGVRGFVPASHVARGYVNNLEQYVGQTLRLKVLEIDRHRRNVVLSRKDVLEQEFQEAKRRLFSTLKEGQVVSGTVRRLTDFGAFIDLGGGVEGLLHVSEMAWSRVRHPSDVLQEGQTVKVMVLNVDREHERISLGLKQVLPNPWDTVAERFHVGQVVQGEVTRLVDFGAFVRLDNGIEGLVHISQLADRHVAKPQEVVSPGQQVRVKILSLDPQARRIGLSLREVAQEEELARGTNPPGSSAGASDASRVTIGELYGNLSQMLDGGREAAEPNGERPASREPAARPRSGPTGSGRGDAGGGP